MRYGILQEGVYHGVECKFYRIKNNKQGCDSKLFTDFFQLNPDGCVLNW